MRDIFDILSRKRIRVDPDTLSAVKDKGEALVRGSVNTTPPRLAGSIRKIPTKSLRLNPSVRSFFKKFSHVFDAYPNLWLKGGGARDAPITFYSDASQRGFERATRSMRDIDLVLIGGSSADKSRLLDEFGGIIHSEDLDIRSPSLGQYFKSRDVGVNEVVLRPEFLMFTTKAVNDLVRGAVNPSGSAYDSYRNNMPPRVALRSILFAIREGMAFPDSPMFNEAVNAARPFDLLLLLHKAFDTGVADAFYAAVRGNPELRSVSSAEEALVALSDEVPGFDRSPSQQRTYDDAVSILMEDKWGGSRVRGSARVAARYKEKKKVKTENGDDTTIYVYSDRQVANRNREKAKRIDTLRKSHADLQDQIKKDLDSANAKTRLTALAVGLIDNTYERVGNDDSAEDGHFGVTGWEKKHLTFSKGKVIIRYTGKSGVKHEKIVSDADLLRVLKDCCDDKDPDDPIFGFPHEDGITKITSRDVNEYLAEYDITAKDLRGYHANREMQEQLRAIRKKGPELPRGRKEKDKILKAEFKKALEAVAEAVGHEPSTLRNQYLVPWMEDTYMKNGEVVDRLDKIGSSRIRPTSRIGGKVGKHRLPPLPYAYDALEPYISEETLKFHHDKHHKAYVDGLNKAEDQIAKARRDEDYEVIPAFNAAMEFNAGGHILHTLYWPSLIPTGDYEDPSDELVKAIEADFDSWDAFRAQMKESTIKVRGSGWGVLVSTPAGLRIVTVMNHENGVLWDGAAILPIDAWEHAYYLDYQNDREAHFDAVFDNLINWSVVERRINEARSVNRVARGKAKKDVGHGGLDEWFSGHDGAKGKGEEARWGDWVSISPVKKTLESGKEVEPGDIVGPCGISDDPDWKDATKGGKDPLKCMPRQKAYDMPKDERAELAKAKQRAERQDKSRGKKPVHTPTFSDKKAGLVQDASEDNEPTDPALWDKAKAKAKKRYTKWPSAYAVGHALALYKEDGGGWRKKATYGSLSDNDQDAVRRGSRLWPFHMYAPPLPPCPADDSICTANEIQEILALSRHRPSHRTLIQSLDTGFASAFIQLCGQLGIPCDERRIQDLITESRPVILALKAYYNRSRPFQLSSEVHPMSLCTTHTPAYPSGHTTQAWVIALDLAARHPKHRKAFFDFARVVAKTRLLAGVHFRTDNDYAETLAKSMVEWLHGTPASRLATKTEGQRQDEEAERLVKPSPKKKPPRKDLRRRRVRDSDATSDPDKEQDQKDRSQNYKDASINIRDISRGS